MYADSSSGGYGHTTDLQTPPITATGPQCMLGFWYYMSGLTVGSLQVFIKSGNTTHEVWSQTGNQGSRWRRGEVFIGIRQNFQVTLRAKRGVSYLGDVVVDDVLFRDCVPPLPAAQPCGHEEFACANGQCVAQSDLCDFINHCGDGSDEDQYICKGYSGRCNFEFDLCSWRQCKEDDFDWRIKAGSTPTLGTGPSTDHTLRSPQGHYLYLEGSFPQAAGDTACISGPQFSHRSRNCKMVFYVHMSGAGVGTLSVYLVSGSTHLLLNLTGEQGNYWIRQEVPLSSSEHFRVTFEGKVGHSGRGDICIDDITFSPGCILSNDPKPDATPQPPSGSCPPGFSQCANGRCFAPEQACDFTDDCGDGSDEATCGTSCTFEEGRCGWRSSQADSFDWMLGVGSVRSIRPPYDHTLGDENGRFVFLEATPVGLRGDKAQMKSSVWREASAACKLAFWYFISHKATGVIRLFVKTESAFQEVWKEARPYGEWRRAEVPLRRLRRFQLIFQGVRSQDVSGGAALDDIEFIDCAPSAVGPGSCAASTDFVCKHGGCVESHVLCDAKADCPDQSDELHCSLFAGLPGSCDFNMPAEQWAERCKLTQAANDDCDWHVGRSRVTAGTGPLTDHSPDGQGGYLYLNSAAQREGDVARVTTRMEFPASVGVCRVRFWFHMFGSERMGTLKVYTAGQSGAPLLMWVTSGNHGDQWHYASVVLSNTVPYRVTFQAEVGGDQQTDIALDDITFTPECTGEGLATPVPLTCGPGQFQCVYEWQCVPSSWVCDGEPDCTDLSDEEGCVSVGPGTAPPPGGCEPGQYRCGDQSCLPALLLCDHVADCPNGEDELGCSEEQCVGGGLVCEGTQGCIPYQRRCDGTPDCLPSLTDESSCHECPQNYCKNGGECQVGPHGPVCMCLSSWTGNRCHVRERPIPTTSTPKTPDSELEAVYAGITGALILLAMAICVTLLFLLQRKRMAKDPGLIDNEELDNAAFACAAQPPLGVGAKAAQGRHPPPRAPGATPALSVYPWREELESPFHRDAKLSFSNPLYKKSRSSDA